jgi:hypothetical protein
MNNLNFEVIPFCNHAALPGSKYYSRKEVIGDDEVCVFSIGKDTYIEVMMGRNAEDEYKFQDGFWYKTTSPLKDFMQEVKNLTA